MIFSDSPLDSITLEGDFRARPRVLVVDDDARFVSSLLRILGEEFEVVGTASNGLEAISEAHRLAPDLIVLDISMPELNGIDAAAQLRRDGSMAKVVFCSGYTEKQIVEACFSTGALAFVTKSDAASDLAPALRHALSNRVFIPSELQH